MPMKLKTVRGRVDVDVAYALDMISLQRNFQGHPRLGSRFFTWRLKFHVLNYKQVFHPAFEVSCPEPQQIPLASEPSGVGTGPSG